MKQHLTFKEFNNIIEGKKERLRGQIKENKMLYENGEISKKLFLDTWNNLNSQLEGIVDLNSEINKHFYK